MKVKICGITDLETALHVSNTGADAIGFVFAKSKRRISPQSAKAIIEKLPSSIEKVGVFVNERTEVIKEIASYCGLTMIQLHGEESMEVCNSFSLPVIKAVGIGNEEDAKKASHYDVDYLLVDSPKGQQYHGGNGETFNWSFLSVMNLTKQKVILAGGLTDANVGMAIEKVHPYMVDVSSGVESNGKKDFNKIEKFIKSAKGVRSI